MSSINQSKIENLSTNKGMKFYNAWVNTDSITVSNISLDNPEGDTTKNYNRNWGGFGRLISISFILFNDGTDKSITTDDIVTLTEQRGYLNNPSNIIQGKAGGAQINQVVYRISVYEEGSLTVFIGAIEDINISADESEPNVLRGTINLSEAVNN